MQQRVPAQSLVIFVRVHASQNFKHPSKLDVEIRNQVATERFKIDNLTKPLRKAFLWTRPLRRTGSFLDRSKALNSRSDFRLSPYRFFLL